MDIETPKVVEFEAIKKHIVELEEQQEEVQKGLLLGQQTLLQIQGALQALRFLIQ